MRALDPRLLRRTKSVRPLLMLDCALGIGTAAAVLVGATMLAGIAARAFGGTPIRSLWPVGGTPRLGRTGSLSRCGWALAQYG